MSVESPELAVFLSSRDLDRLAAARDEIHEISASDVSRIRDIVESESDPQAVANLLMYPELIPPNDREAALAKALSGEPNYAMVAAVVGVQRAAEANALSEAFRNAVAERLVLLAGSSLDTIAARSTLALAELMDAVDLDEMLAVLERADEVVRHNLIAIAIPAVGAREIRQRLAALEAAGRLSDATVTDALRVLELRGPAALPRLVFVPNRDDWNGRR
jgi:hypothetical protein